jgi:hypothetical protein
LSRTTGKGVPAGTSRRITAGDPATTSVVTELSACPKLNPEAKKIEMTVKGTARMRFIILF